METKLAEIFKEIIGFEPMDEMEPGKTEGWDSLGNVDLFTAIEDEFRLEISFDEMMEITTWKDLRECVLRKVKEQ